MAPDAKPVQESTMSGQFDAGLCPRYHRAVELIGRRWTGAIVFVLLGGRRRFGELRAAIPAITDRMLSERLKELEQEGIVRRHVVPGTPVRVEYELTSGGEALARPVEALATWAHDWLPATDEDPESSSRTPRA
jgi:DNA-binding HxlR family transcriptional regulator